MHQNFRRNKRVFVIFKDGRYVIDKWHTKDGKRFMLIESGWHNFSNVKSIGIYREPTKRL